MKVKLPFVVQPKYAPKKILIGSEESGQFEIERRGYLTVQEKAFVQMAMKESGNGAMIKVIGTIAKQEGKKQSDVIADLQGYVPGETESYLDNYGEELLSLTQEISQASEIQKMSKATALLISRHDNSWDFNDTLTLHSDIVDDLANLYDDEENKSIKDLIDDADQDSSVEVDKGKDGKVSK